MKPVEVTVRDTTFVIHPMDPFTALKTFGDLQKELLPAIGDLLTLGEAEKPDPEQMSKGIEKLSQKLDGKQLEYWSARLITKDSVFVEVNGSVVPVDASTRDLAFKEFTDILEVMWHVVRINFAGPLRAFLNRFGKDLSLVKADK